MYLLGTEIKGGNRIEKLKVDRGIAFINTPKSNWLRFSYFRLVHCCLWALKKPLDVAGVDRKARRPADRGNLP